MFIKAIKKFIFECLFFLILITVLYPQVKQIMDQLNNELMLLGAPAGINLNVKDLLLNPVKAENDMMNELVQILNSF